MFPKITLNSKSDFNQIGLLCESLLFYQQANLVLNPPSFAEALRIIGYQNMVELIQEGGMSIHVNNQGLGVGNIEGDQYMISAFKSEAYNKAKLVTEAAQKVWGKNIQSRNQSKHLIKLIREHDYSEQYTEIVSREVLDAENFKDAIVTQSKGKVNRGYIEIEIQRGNSGVFNIQSNCDKQLIKDAAYLICTGSGLLHDSKAYNSELITDSTVATYPASRVQRLINRRLATESQIKTFHQFVLPKFHDIRSTIDSGAKQFSDFMELYRTAKKFKHWLNGEEPNVELLSAYIAKISENSWLDQTPVKVLRWILFTAAGYAIGDLTGASVGAVASPAIDFFDDILLDGIIRRDYKPNQFVQNEYKDFLNLGL